MSLPLAVIDPALGETEGHHAGFAAMLAQSLPAGRRASLWTHRSLSAEAAHPLRQAGIAVEPVFASHYYRHFGKPGNPASLAPYILALAREYARVQERLCAAGRPCRLLYHTLSWEHANALALALAASPPAPGLQHRVLLMFNPGIDHRGRTFRPHLRLNYRVALAPLARLPGVKLYAGCGEHAESYAGLLELKAPLPLHPCLLGDWSRPPVPRPACPAPQAMRYLLYLGDAKSDKGYTRLPQIVGRLRTQCGPDARFVIHYNRLPKWASPALKEAESRLAALAAEEPRIELHAGFWPADELRRQLDRADLLVLAYDAQDYAEKTSGLLWLAAWHGLPALLPPGWLRREAGRLGLPHGPLDALENPARLADNIDRACQPDPAYRKAIFTPFWEWLDTD